MMRRGLVLQQALLERIREWKADGFQAPPKDGVMPSDAPGIKTSNRLDPLKWPTEEVDVRDYICTIGDTSASASKASTAKPAISGLTTEWDGDHRLGNFKGEQ